MAGYCTRVIDVVRLQRVIQGLILILQAVVDLLEDCIIYALLKQMLTTADSPVHLGDEVVIGNLAILSRGHHPHQVVYLIVSESNFKRVKSCPELCPVYKPIAIDIKHCKRLLKIKVLQEEGCCNLIKSLVKTDCPEI